MRRLVFVSAALLATIVSQPLLADQPRPRLFNLAGRTSLRDALAALTAQTGVRIEDQTEQGDKSISLTCKDLFFWQAIDSIAEASGASVYLYPRSGRITLVKRPKGHSPPPTNYDGYFRCSLKRTMSSLEIETGQRRCVLSIEVAWEPDLQPLFLEVRPQDVRLVDDRGQVVHVPPEGSSIAPVDGRTSLVTDVLLPGLPRSAQRIGELSGRFHVIAPTKMLTFVFPSLDALAKAAAEDDVRRQEQKNVQCRINKVDLARDHWSIRVILDYPPGNKELESYQSWVVNNEMVLVSEDGKRRLPATDYVLEAASTRRALLTYHFRDKDKQLRGKPEEWRLTYRTPAAILEWPVRFSFKDVPLP
jgi:hypothetical protein